MGGETNAQVSLHRYAATEAGGTRAGGGAAVPAARKAVDLEALVTWTYRDQCADREAPGSVVPRGMGWERGWSADGCGAVERYALLGAFVDCSGAAGVAHDPHPDAERVETLVAGMDAEARTLIRAYGRMGERPDWLPGWRPRMEPKWKGRPGRVTCGRIVEGKVEKIWDRNRNWIGCKVEMHDPPGFAEGMRAQYLAWHDAMGELLGMVRGEVLKAHRVTGFGAVRVPWG